MSLITLATLAAAPASTLWISQMASFGARAESRRHARRGVAHTPALFGALEQSRSDKRESARDQIG
jgi:hypothetical protein